MNVTSRDMLEARRRGNLRNNQEDESLLESPRATSALEDYICIPTQLPQYRSSEYLPAPRSRLSELVSAIKALQQCPFESKNVSVVKIGQLRGNLREGERDNIRMTGATGAPSLMQSRPASGRPSLLAHSPKKKCHQSEAGYYGLSRSGEARVPKGGTFILTREAKEEYLQQLLAEATLRTIQSITGVERRCSDVVDGDGPVTIGPLTGRDGGRDKGNASEGTASAPPATPLKNHPPSAPSHATGKNNTAKTSSEARANRPSGHSDKSGEKKDSGRDENKAVPASKSPSKEQKHKATVASVPAVPVPEVVVNLLHFLSVRVRCYEPKSLELSPETLQAASCWGMGFAITDPFDVAGGGCDNGEMPQQDAQVYKSKRKFTGLNLSTLDPDGADGEGGESGDGEEEHVGGDKGDEVRGRGTSSKSAKKKVEKKEVRGQKDVPKVEKDEEKEREKEKKQQKKSVGTRTSPTKESKKTPDREEGKQKQEGAEGEELEESETEAEETLRSSSAQPASEAESSPRPAHHVEGRSTLTEGGGVPALLVVVMPAVALTAAVAAGGGGSGGEGLEGVSADAAVDDEERVAVQSLGADSTAVCDVEDGGHRGTEEEKDPSISAAAHHPPDTATEESDLEGGRALSFVLHSEHPAVGASGWGSGLLQLYSTHRTDFAPGALVPSVPLVPSVRSLSVVRRAHAEYVRQQQKGRARAEEVRLEGPRGWGNSIDVKCCPQLADRQGDCAGERDDVSVYEPQRSPDEQHQKSRGPQSLYPELGPETEDDCCLSQGGAECRLHSDEGRNMDRLDRSALGGSIPNHDPNNDPNHHPTPNRFPTPNRYAALGGLGGVRGGGAIGGALSNSSWGMGQLLGGGLADIDIMAAEHPLLYKGTNRCGGGRDGTRDGTMEGEGGERVVRLEDVTSMRFAIQSGLIGVYSEAVTVPAVPIYKVGYGVDCCVVDIDGSSSGRTAPGPVSPTDNNYNKNRNNSNTNNSSNNSNDNNNDVSVGKPGFSPRRGGKYCSKVSYVSADSVMISRKAFTRLV